MERDELKDLIWQLLKDAIYAQTDFKINKEALTLDTEALSVFPTDKAENPYFNEDANAYGIAILRVWMYLNAENALDLKVNYEIRREFELFPTFGHASRYIFANFGPVLIGGK